MTDCGQPTIHIWEVYWKRVPSGELEYYPGLRRFDGDHSKDLVKQRDDAQAQIRLRVFGVTPNVHVARTAAETDERTGVVCYGTAIAGLCSKRRR